MSKLTFGATFQSPNLQVNSKTQQANSTQLANGCDTKQSKPYTVTLVKREYGGFGFLIRQRNEPPYLSIWEIIKDGSAEKNGQIRKGDIITKVNREDLSEVGYERGLEILKSIKPGSCVELTLQSMNGSLQDPVDLIDFCSPVNNMASNKSVMSPLQRLKKKLISCASPKVSNENKMVIKENTNDHVTSNHHNKLDSKTKRQNEATIEKEQRPTYFNSPLIERRISAKNDSLNSNQPEMIDESNQNKTVEVQNRIAPLDNFDKYLNHMTDKKTKKDSQLAMDKHEVSPKVRSRTLDTFNLNENSQQEEAKVNEEKSNSEEMAKMVSKSRSMTVNKSNLPCNSPRCKKNQTKLIPNQNNKNSTIQIVQDGDDIRINIDGAIEILTNRFNDKKVISLSPRILRKIPSGNKIETTSQKESFKESGEPIADKLRIDGDQNVKVEEDEKKTEFITELPLNKIESKEKNDEKNIIPSLIENETQPKLSKSNFENNKPNQVSVHNLLVPNPSDKSIRRTSSSESFILRDLQKFNSNETIGSKSLKKKKGVKLKFLIDESNLIDTLHQKANEVIFFLSIYIF
jgi:hypothetical protein